jgi:adenine-specific DNA-methyltransferase
MDKSGKIVFTGKEPKAKRYLKDVQQGVPPSTLLEPAIVGFNKDATALLNEIFDGSKVFDQPKPPTLIEFLLQIQKKVDKNDFIVLDSFAGSGSTAHAVLNLNQADGGNRKFILIEMEDYAETITAERVKRVINGYGKTAGMEGGFDYYKLGERLFGEDNLLNPKVDIVLIRNYIWYSEIRKAFPLNVQNVDNQYFLGQNDGIAYYFQYEPDTITCLGNAFLETVRTPATHYVMYADKCTLSETQLEKYRITFKKIPRDITRF